NAELGTFVQSYDDTRLDASVLMIPIVPLLPRGGPPVLSTMHVLQRELTMDGLVQRYLPHDEVDGIGEPEGVFLACSFWMVGALAAAGGRNAVVGRFRRHA